MKKCKNFPIRQSEKETQKKVKKKIEAGKAFKLSERICVVYMYSACKEIRNSKSIQIILQKKPRVKWIKKLKLKGKFSMSLHFCLSFARSLAVYFSVVETFFFHFLYIFVVGKWRLFKALRNENFMKFFKVFEVEFFFPKWFCLYAKRF